MSFNYLGLLKQKLTLDGEICKIQNTHSKFVKCKFINENIKNITVYKVAHETWFFFKYISRV